MAVVAAALAGAPEGVAAASAPPQVDTAAAAIVVDGRDGAVMFQKRPDQRRQIASATKLMTALLALERAGSDEVFTAPRYDALPAESRINLRAGERMRVDDLLEALLLESANDAAVTIAEGVAGSRRAFVRKMNERAAELGLGRTGFANPIGLDDPDNGSTARDLARLTVRLMRDRRFARIVDMPAATLESGARRRVVRNRNRLVARYDFVDGVKTGHTLQAGYVLVGAATEPTRSVVTVVLGEPGEAARDADTVALLRWGLGQFHRVTALRADHAVERVAVKHRDERAALVPRHALGVTARRGQRIGRRVHAPSELEGPLEAGAKVGTVTVTRDGRPVRRVDLLTANEVPGPGTWRMLLSSVGLPLTFLLLLGMLVVGAVAARRLRVRR